MTELLELIYKRIIFFYIVVVVEVLRSDIDECLTKTHSCHIDSTVCVNKNGSYQCECKGGFSRLNEFTCVGSHN